MTQEQNDTSKDSLKKGSSVAAVIVLSWIIIGTILFHNLESWTYAQSFYYSVTTLTTVGYGDFVPTTDFNRVITALYMLIGVTITLGAFGYIGSNYIARREAMAQKRAEKRLNSIKK